MNALPIAQKNNEIMLYHHSSRLDKQLHSNINPARESPNFAAEQSPSLPPGLKFSKHI